MFEKLPPQRKAEMVSAAIRALLLFLGFLIVTILVLTKSFLYDFDHWIKGLRHHTFKGMSSHIIIAIDDLGLRSFATTVLVAFALFIGFRFKTWRPLNLSILAFVALNGVVGV